MQVAMKDLEIRGAGNLLGGEQSGHIADVGFDLYVRMVGEALADFKGEKSETDTTVKIELPLDAYLPHDYVPSERLRLDMYRRLAEATTGDSIEEVRAELVDRFGALPQPVLTLLKVAELRLVVAAAGLTEVIASGPSIRFAPVNLPDSIQMRIARLYPRSTIKAATRTVMIPKPQNPDRTDLEDDDLLQWVHSVLVAVGSAIPSASNPVKE
jgi:transcription-repair coupling factor (superfamily II helicase)